jgi:hypothetical protein
MVDEYKETPPETKTVPKEEEKPKTPTPKSPSQSTENIPTTKPQLTKSSSTNPQEKDSPTSYKPPGGKPKRKYHKKPKPKEWVPGWRSL